MEGTARISIYDEQCKSCERAHRGELKLAKYRESFLNSPHIREENACKRNLKQVPPATT